MLDKLSNKEAHSSPPKSDTLLTGRNAGPGRERQPFQQGRVHLDPRQASQPQHKNYVFSKVAGTVLPLVYNFREPRCGHCQHFSSRPIRIHPQQRCNSRASPRDHYPHPTKAFLITLPALRSWLLQISKPSLSLHTSLAFILKHVLFFQTDTNTFLVPYFYFCHLQWGLFEDSEMSQKSSKMVVKK